MREVEKRTVRAVEIACLISCERVNGGENREVKWAYVVVWRDVKQRNAAVVVDLYLTIRFVACSVVCASRRARPRAGPGGRQASPNIEHRRYT